MTDEVERLRAELAQLRLMANTVPVAIAYYEAEGRTCRMANRRYAEMFGFDETNIVGRTLAAIIGDEAASMIEPYRQSVIEQQTASAYERQVRGADGIARMVEVRLLPHVAEEGHTLGAFVLIADITHHRRAEAALRESEERLAKFMHASEEGIVFHKGGYITDANPPLLNLLGYTLPEMLGRLTLEFIAPEEQQKVAEVIAAAPETRYDSVAVHKDGTRIPVQFIVRTMQYQGEPQRMTIVRDIRDRLQAELRIQHLAHHDALTGLPNRLAFAERLERRLAEARASGESLALMFVDLDHFKRINDSLGHAVGDTLLRTVATRITETLRLGDTVARFGGDEFLVLLAPRAGAPAVAEVAARLLVAIGEPLHAAGVSISVTPSIGVAMFPQHAQTPAELIHHADQAMYRAKAGRAGALPLLRGGHGRSGAHRTRDGEPPGAGGAPGRIHAALPAPGGAWQRARAWRGGAGALGPPAAWTHRPRRIHPAGRGAASDPADRRLGARAGAGRRGALAQGRRGRGAGGRQPIHACSSRPRVLPTWSRRRWTAPLPRVRCWSSNSPSAC